MSDNIINRVLCSGDQAVRLGLKQRNPYVSDHHSRHALVADFVRGMLLTGGGSTPALEIQEKARAFGLLGADEQIAQSRIFRAVKKSMAIEVRRKGFGPGSKMIWTLPADEIRIDEQPVEPEPTQGLRAETNWGANVTNGSTNSTPTEANLILEQPTAINERRLRGKAVINEPPSILPLVSRHYSKTLDKDPRRLAAEALVAEWRAGIAKLEFQNRLQLIHPVRWSLFLADAKGFLNSPFALRAALLAWTSEAAFGLNANRGLVAIGQLGLIWCVQGGAILELDRDGALIERAGSPKPHSRRAPHPAVCVPWELDLAEHATKRASSE